LFSVCRVMTKVVIWWVPIQSIGDVLSVWCTSPPLTHRQTPPILWIWTHHITDLVMTPQTPNNFNSHHFNNYLFLACIYVPSIILTKIMVIWSDGDIVNYNCILVKRTLSWTWPGSWPKHVCENTLNKIHHKYYSALLVLYIFLDLINAWDMERTSLANCILPLLVSYEFEYWLFMRQVFNKRTVHSLVGFKMYSTFSRWKFIHFLIARNEH
jgi:hypothetical protein